MVSIARRKILLARSRNGAQRPPKRSRREIKRKSNQKINGEPVQGNGEFNLQSILTNAASADAAAAISSALDDMIVGDNMPILTDEEPRTGGCRDCLRIRGWLGLFSVFRRFFFAGAVLERTSSSFSQ